ncbi:MAG: glycosyltransferase family 4 protein [Bacteroidota bacterium]
MAKSKQSIKALLIGPLPDVKGNKIGGARVSFSELQQYFQNQGIAHELVNTQSISGGIGRLFKPFYILLQVLLRLPKVDVLFVNLSQSGTKTLAPLLFVWSRLLGKKFVFRPFGGSLKDYYEAYHPWQKWLFDQTLLRSDLFFFQTVELLTYFRALGANGVQLPTSRKNQTDYLRDPQQAFQKRFVFVGHVKASKGIDLALAAFEQLDDSYTIHFYGPIKEDKYKTLFAKEDSPYRGLLKKEEVLPKLSQYDVLILPTYFSGEGYPGAIIEAYSLGLPVIASRWKAIPEIVQEQKTGYLIQPKSVDALVEGIRFFSSKNYPELSGNARQYFLDAFEIDAITGRAWQQIKALWNK